MSQVKNREEFKDIPFLYGFVKPADKDRYTDEIKSWRIAEQRYDPKTQTSDIDVSSGTYKTYGNTFSGLMKSRDDEKVTDT